MKKLVLAILILAMTAVACFAGEDTFCLNSTVVYDNAISMNLVASTSENGTYTADDVSVNLKENGTVYFKVLDQSHYNSVEAASYSVTLSATAFTNSNSDQVACTISGLSNIACANLSYSNLSASSFTVTYAAYKSIINADAPIASFAASWVGNNQVIAGHYTSTITLDFVAI